MIASLAVVAFNFAVLMFCLTFQQILIYDKISNITLIYVSKCIHSLFKIGFNPRKPVFGGL